MSQDFELAFPLLCEGRPYTLDLTNKTVTFCFRPDETISVLRAQNGQVVNDISTFQQLKEISEKHIVRLPGMAGGRLNHWHLGYDSIVSSLAKGEILRLNRANQSLPTEDSIDWIEWLDNLKVPQLNVDYIRKRLCEEHAHNIKAQYVPIVPSIGMLVNPEKTPYLRLSTVLKEHVDVDFSDTTTMFLLGILPSYGEKNDVALWLKKYLPQILMPEVLNNGRLSHSKFETRLKNTFMQIDHYLHEKEYQETIHDRSGAGLALGVYIPDARLVISIALGDSVILIFDEKGQYVRSTYSLAPGDGPERMRIQKNGYMLASNGCLGDTSLNVSRALGLFAYKSTCAKPYSRAYGAISSTPEVSIQRLSNNEPFWLCTGKASQLQRSSIAPIGAAIAENRSLNAQRLCAKLSQQFELSDLMISKLEVGMTVRM